MGAIRIGCSGWQYRDWRGVLYPEGLAQPRWLARYAEVFDTVEVNATFYRLARPAAVERWIADTPPGFLLTLKGSRYITHMKRLADTGEAVPRFYEGVAPLVGSPKLGPVLWQLHEGFKADLDRLAAFLAALPDGRHAFELRHPSWWTDDCFALLQAYGAAFAVGDDPRRARPPLVATTSWSLVRLHFGERGRRGNYAETELRTWAARLQELAATLDGEVLVYLNNDWEGFAVRNARRLQRLTRS